MHTPSKQRVGGSRSDDRPAQSWDSLAPQISLATRHRLGRPSRWLEVSGIESGALFRKIDRHAKLSTEALSGQSVGLIVKRVLAVTGSP
jgi:hypothetical protein